MPLKRKKKKKKTNLLENMQICNNSDGERNGNTLSDFERI